MYQYDVAVIGSGPGGQHAAIQAAKLNKHALLIERQRSLGGICINNGTIPSKTLREAIIYLTGYREHDLYGASYQVKPIISMSDLLYRTEHVIRHEIDVLQSKMRRNRVELVHATASFVDPHTLRLALTEESGYRDVTAENIVIATGTEAARPPDIPIEDEKVFVPDTLLSMDQVPRTMAVIGGGVIGTEYASMFSALGVRVTLIEQRPRLLDFVDSEMVDDLLYHLRERRVVTRLGERVSGLVVEDNGVSIALASGKRVFADVALYSIGRLGATKALNLACLGLDTDERGRLQVNENYQTAVPHIYAVGDVIGFPSLASTSREQGRIAIAKAYNLPVRTRPDHFPYGIYALPEISFVGLTEEQLTAADVPYEVGVATYRESTRGEILGDSDGKLKLLFHRETLVLLGVHVIGDGASELVHIGQAVLALGGTVEYFIDTVLNYPTLAECYKVAAFDGLGRIGRYW